MGLFSRKHTAVSQPQRRQVGAGDSRPDPLADLDQRYNFRRNRTLTGSVSSHVASVSESNAQLKSPRVQSHELIKKRRRIGTLFALAILGALAFYGLTQQFTAEAVVEASAVNDELSPSYKEAIQDYFGTRPIERFRFLTNQEGLTDHVRQKLPEVASIKIIGSAGLGKSLYYLTMREPLAGWTIQGKHQYVDASGTAFEKNYYPVPAVQIVDNSGVRPESGQAVASNRFLGFVGRTVGLARSQGYTVTQVAIPQTTTRQVEIRLEGIVYPIKMSIDRSVGEQVEDMTRLIRWFQGRKETPQYIDIRVSGKAFYK